MSYAHPSDYRTADEDEDEEEIDYKFEPTYIAFITGVRAKSRDDIQVFDIATEKTFRFLNKNYFDSDVDLTYYIMNTGLDAPREKLIFVFDENACVLEKKRNIVMDIFFRDVFPNESSNPFEHGAYGTFVAYYLHDEAACPYASMEMPLDMPALVLCLQKQASINWNLEPRRAEEAWTQDRKVSNGRRRRRR